MAEKANDTRWYSKASGSCADDSSRWTSKASSSSIFLTGSTEHTNRTGQAVSRFLSPESQGQDGSRSDKDDGLLQAVLDYGKALQADHLPRPDPAPSKTRSAESLDEVHYVDCPLMEKALAIKPRISLIMGEVARCYEVPHVVLTWREAGLLCFHLHPGDGLVLRVAKPTDSPVFNHRVARQLPIIMNTDKASSSVPAWMCALPSCIQRPRFYAASPLVLSKSAYVGTLCIVDDSCSRPGFTLKDADLLVDKAKKLVEVLEELRNEQAGESAWILD